MDELTSVRLGRNNSFLGTVPTGHAHTIPPFLEQLAALPEIRLWVFLVSV